jgi:mannitol-specific phosphotransferase system IIBC component
MKLTQQRQLEQEQTIEASIPRISVIDSAVGKLQVQMEEVIARQGRYDRVLSEAHAAIQALLRDLREIEESRVEPELRNPAGELI